MKKLKIAVIGSGSTYAPEIISGLIEHRDSIPVGTIALMDIDEHKNGIVSGLSTRMLKNANMDVNAYTTTSIEEAVKGADYVLTQIRVGMLDARIRDEKIPLKYGLLGQETTGAGGFMKAMRTIPVMLHIADTIQRLAPDAWLINFTNPSGLITEMLLNYTKVKAIGLCNCPINMIARMEEFLDVKSLDYDFVGLNHLSFMTAVYKDGREILHNLIQQPLDESKLEEVLDAEYSHDLLRVIDAIPCSYLQYYYFRQDRVQKCKDAEKTRGEECKEIEAELLAQYADENLVTKPEGLSKRGGARYSEAAISLIDAIENDRGEFHTVNVRNDGACPWLADTDVVEIKCKIDKNGAHPQQPKNFDNPHLIGLMQAVKSYEKIAAKAGITGNYDMALAALVSHPLVGDYAKAKPVLDEMLAANAEYLPQFNK